MSARKATGRGYRPGPTNAPGTPHGGRSDGATLRAKAEVDHERGISRINIVTTGTELVVEQIKALLDKLVPVHQVRDLTVEGVPVERELAMVKVRGDRERLIDALRIADFMGARLVDRSTECFIFEVTGTSDEIDAFIAMIQPAEVSRAGVVAIGRGASVLEPRAR